MRVASKKQVTLADKSTGWIHEGACNVALPVRRAPEPEPDVDFEAMLTEWQAYDNSRNAGFAKFLGVSETAINKLQCTWAQEYHAFGFPMRDWNGAICGIRLRNMRGDKWAVRGSHQGCFVPCGTPDKTAWIVEGPTDCAAGLTIGMFCIGRPACSGAVHQLLGNLKRLGVQRCIILADNDVKNEFKHGRNSGIQGAKDLAEHLPMPHCIMPLPAKDLRAFVNAGGTKPLIESILKNFVWKQPNDQAQRRERE